MDVVFCHMFAQAQAQALERKSEGALPLESAFIFGGDKPNSVPSRLPVPAMIISLDPLARTAARLAARWCDYYPGAVRLAPDGEAAQAPCFVLHRMGFVVPRRLRAGRWAFTPPFHPCPWLAPRAVCFL